MRPLKSTSLLFAGLGLLAVSHPAYAQDTDDEIITTGARQAYFGDFDPLEVPASDQLIDSVILENTGVQTCLLYTSPSPRDQRGSRMPSSA